MVKLLRSFFFLTLTVLLILPGCGGLGVHQDSYQKLRHSALFDADKNLRGGCSRDIRTKNNLLKPAALRKIFIGMEKEQVINKIGQPHYSYNFLKDNNDNLCEVFEYSLDKGDRSEAIACTILTLGLAFPLLLCEAEPGKIENYWLYFYDNKLVQCNKLESTSSGYAGNTNVSSRPTGNANTSSGYTGSGVTGYGEISKTTGRVRSNVVSGHYRSNGTYVKSYARS